MKDTSPHLLLAEDDLNFGSVLKDYLELNGFTASLARDGAEAVRLFKEEEPQLCVLDVMMPQKDGFAVADTIRKIDDQVPIIFLTAKTMKEDMLRGYQLGADDYLTKPFDSEVLLYKIKAVLNRAQPVPEEVKEYEIGRYNYHVESRELRYSGMVQTLSPKEGALLHILAENKNQLVSRSYALNKIWKDDNYFTGRSMDVYMAKLRKYLKKDPQVAIVNVHSEGFRLVDKL